MNLKQIFCKHKYKFLELNREMGKAYFVYQCEKCGKLEFVMVSDVVHEMENVAVDLKLIYGYDKMELWLPAWLYHDIPGDQRYYSRQVSVVLERWLKKGIDLRDYWRMKNVCCNNESCEGADQGAHQHAEEDG